MDNNDDKSQNATIPDIMEAAGISIEEIAEDIKKDTELEKFIEENALANRASLYRVRIRKICMKEVK